MRGSISQVLAIFVYIFLPSSSYRSAKDTKHTLNTPQGGSLESLRLIGQFTEKQVFVIVGVHACRTQCVCVVACGLLALACTTPQQPQAPQATSNRGTKGGREMMEEAHKGFDRGGGQRRGDTEGWTGVVKECDKYIDRLIKKFTSVQGVTV